MDRAPGWAEVLGQWVADPLWLAFLAAALSLYAWGMVRARDRRFVHPASRAVWFGFGAAAVAAAVFSPLAHYGRTILWVDFTGFLFLTMIAPPLLWLGAPLTLAFRATGKLGQKRLRAFYRSRPVAIVTFPVGTWLAFAVTTYLWQFTSLTDLAGRNDIARSVQQLTLLAVGLLFWLPVVAVDPMRWRLAFPLRALYVVVEMTHKGLFGGMFLSLNTAIHHGFAGRAPSWAPDPMTDQRTAILILWIGGNLVFLVALVAMVFKWVAYEQRNQRRTDRRLALQREAARKRKAALEQVFTRPV